MTSIDLTFGISPWESGSSADIFKVLAFEATLFRMKLSY